jgi:hypothetical protein
VVDGIMEVEREEELLVGRGCAVGRCTECEVGGEGEPGVLPGTEVDHLPEGGGGGWLREADRGIKGMPDEVRDAGGAVVGDEVVAVGAELR